MVDGLGSQRGQHWGWSLTDEGRGGCMPRHALTHVFPRTESAQLEKRGTGDWGAKEREMGCRSQPLRNVQDRRKPRMSENTKGQGSSYAGRPPGVGLEGGIGNALAPHRAGLQRGRGRRGVPS